MQISKNKLLIRQFKRSTSAYLLYLIECLKCHTNKIFMIVKDRGEKKIFLQISYSADHKWFNVNILLRCDKQRQTKSLFELTYLNLSTGHKYLGSV